MACVLHADNCGGKYCGSAVLLLLSVLELLGETRIIRIIKLIIIIRAGTTLVSHSFNFNWKRRCIDPKIQYIFWIPAKVEGITDERGTGADYYNLYYYYYNCFT